MLFPSRCPACGLMGAAPCPACRVAMRPLSPAASPAVPGVDRVVACFEYGGPARAVLTALKYRNNRAALPWLGGCLAAAWHDHGLSGVLTWAPTGAARSRRRGFDQAELLARHTARALARPPAPGPPRPPGSPAARPAGPAVAPVPLLRRLPGPAQTGRAGRERHDAVHFEPRRRWWGTGPGPVPDRVVLVDDVVTTGATLAAAAAALRRAGCRRVEALVVARTPDPGRPFR